MSTHASFRSETIEATVQAGDAEIVYRRSGVGRPTLLLCDPGDPAREPAFRALASNGMVVEPSGLPAAPAARVRWLRSVVDGSASTARIWW